MVSMQHVQENIAATSHQTLKNKLISKSNAVHSQSCGVVETTTPTQRRKTKT